MEENNTTPSQEPAPVTPAPEKTPLFYKKELLITLLSFLVISLAFGLLTLCFNFPTDLANLQMSKGKVSIDYNPAYLTPVIVLACLNSLLVTLLGLFAPLLPSKPTVNKAKNWIVYLILLLLGLAAYFIIAFGLMAYKLPLWAALIIDNFICDIYLYLMLKLYLYNYVEDKRLFYEIIRFALVGIIAGLFDFATCYVFEFKILPQSWADIWLTIVSVTMGFIIGVTVNYLCSVYMVYKATTDKSISKTMWGKVLFVILAAVGLGINYLLQWLFYDKLGLGFLTVFIIRTLIVMVWNYLSRKYLIFK
jgi:putative flippase GtrA